MDRLAATLHRLAGEFKESSDRAHMENRPEASLALGEAAAAVDRAALSLDQEGGWWARLIRRLGL